MSRFAYDFLNDSFLFNLEQIDREFDGIDEKKMRSELDDYREHILRNLSNIREELTPTNLLSIYFDTAARSRPPIALLRQSALYYDRVILDDPLFALTRHETEAEDVVTRYLGYAKSIIDRSALAAACRLMFEARPMVGADFVHFAPVSLLHEPPERVPFNVSENLFAERIPEELRPWFHSKARVFPLQRGEDGVWFHRIDAELHPARGIAIDFPDFPGSFVFHLFETEFTPTEDESRIALRQWLPSDAPDQAQFDVWVEQSINQSGGDVLKRVSIDLAHATGSGSMLFTNSPFVAEMLSLQVGEQRSLQEDIANLAFKLDLPVLSAVSTEQLMTIRQQEGEAFRSFRTALESNLRDIRSETDENVIRSKLQEIAHELTEVQVRDVEREVRRLKRELFGSLAVGVASLATIIPSGGFSIATLIAGGAGAYKAGADYMNRVKEHPAYFLWRMQKAAQ